MGRLIYSSLISLDGFVNDAGGRFEWAMPSAEVHAFVNEVQRPIGTYLYGRRLYETMCAWETEPALAATNAVTADFAAIWRAADKIVYSSTMTEPVTARTRIERAFDPDDVRRLKETSPADLLIGGPTLAAAAMRAGLVDDYLVFVAPVLVGSGTAFFPPGLAASLELVDLRRFQNGMGFLRYAAH